MHLVEILLPVTDNRGVHFSVEKFAQVRERLAARFGGITAFTRAPAQGTTSSTGGVVHDDIVVFEVMTETLDRAWWAAYRHELERDFEQDEILIRASTVQRL